MDGGRSPSDSQAEAQDRSVVANTRRSVWGCLAQDRPREWIGLAERRTSRDGLHRSRHRAAVGRGVGRLRQGALATAHRAAAPLAQPRGARPLAQPCVPPGGHDAQGPHGEPCLGVGAPARGQDRLRAERAGFKPAVQGFVSGGQGPTAPRVREARPMRPGPRPPLQLMPSGWITCAAGGRGGRDATRHARRRRQLEACGRGAVVGAWPAPRCRSRGRDYRHARAPPPAHSPGRRRSQRHTVGIVRPVPGRIDTP